MIITVTPNPCIDLTMQVSEIRRGEVQRTRVVLVEASGKGVNVAVALHAAGREATAVLPVGSRFGHELTSMLTQSGIRHVAVPVATPIRVNVSIVEDEGTTTKINDPGSPLTDDETEQMIVASLEASRAGDWIAWCGSLPMSSSVDFFARGVAAARAANRLVAVDTSGPVLDRVLNNAPSELPHLIKPNCDELATLVGHELTTVGSVVAAARQLVSGGVRTVLVSMGASGAVLVESDDALWGQSSVTNVVNTAGAGDAALAGYLATVGSPRQRLASALVFGASAVERCGTLLGSPIDINRRTVITAADPAHSIYAVAE